MEAPRPRPLSGRAGGCLLRRLALESLPDLASVVVVAVVEIGLVRVTVLHWLVLVLVGDAVLDLVEFSTYPRIGFVSIRVKACECLETFVWTTMVYEPLTNS